jgi:YesN/AraC family two-component response regulator
VGTTTVGVALQGRGEPTTLRPQPGRKAQPVSLPRGEVLLFEVLQQLHPDRLPLVIFVTAYDQHALRAFEVHALDYLLKPFKPARFKETLQRVRKALATPSQNDTAQKLLAHNVFVALKDNSDEAKKQFVESCKKYLSQHSGIVFFAVGTSTDAQGQFNDKEFDISLNMVFTSKSALDTYARSQQHQKFLAENTAGIKGVRVFDADVERTSVPDDKK